MPTYEFKCKNCDNRFTKFTTIAGRKDVCCPKCQSKDVQQVYSGFMFIKGDNNIASFGSGSSTSSSRSGGGCSGSCAGCSGC